MPGGGTSTTSLGSSDQGASNPTVGIGTYSLRAGARSAVPRRRTAHTNGQRAGSDVDNGFVHEGLRSAATVLTVTVLGLWVPRLWRPPVQPVARPGAALPGAPSSRPGAAQSGRMWLSPARLTLT